MRDQLVGYYTTEYGDRVKVLVDVEVKAVQGGSGLTIEHEPRPEPCLRFTVSGMTYEQRRNHRWVEGSGGQIIDDLKAVTKFAPGWDAARRDELVTLWERWHLNDMKGECAHMTPAPRGMASSLWGFEIGALDNPTPRPLTVEGHGHVGLVTGGQTVTLSHYTVNKALVCPVSGYRYGHAWLTEVIPPDVLERMRQFTPLPVEALQ